MLGIFICNAQIKNSKTSKKPNVLMIIVDDFGWRDIHAYGSTFYETPNMDKLISQSLKFTQAYATYPRCVPSRFSIMTGTHPSRLKGDSEEGERDGEGSSFNVKHPNVSIGKIMHDNGYNTFYIGKWHLGEGDFSPLGTGFDRSIASGLAGATSSHFAPYNIGRSGTVSKEAPIPDLENATEGENLEDRLTEETIKLIKETANKQQPFFGILAHYAVHTPIQGKEEYKKYFLDKLKNTGVPSGPDYEPEIAGETKLKQDNLSYAAMIKSVDDGIGKIMKVIDNLRLSDNTIIVVTSDHGGLSTRGNKRELATSNMPLRAGKGSLYEGGIRVPLFIRWPGIIKGGAETNSIVQGIDYLPTIVDMVGGKLPSTQILDGLSFIDVIKNNQKHTDRTIYFHNSAPRPISTGDIYSSVIRSGDFKLIDFYALGKKELYNVKDDIGEKINIAPQNPDLVQRLYAELVNWRNSVGADMRIKRNSLSEAERKVLVEFNRSEKK